MKKYIFVVSLLCLLAACTGKRQGEAAVEIAALPAVEDVVMYQVNPRVFAPEKSFKAVERRLDSIQALGINVVWFMPINEVGQEKSVNSPYCVKDYKGVNPEFGTLDETTPPAVPPDCSPSQPPGSRPRQSRSGYPRHRTPRTSARHCNATTGRSHSGFRP